MLIFRLFDFLIYLFIFFAGNDTRYVIEPRQLEYGLYQIQFNASMYDTVHDRFVLETDSTIEGYFVIKQCDLFAKIEGGTGKAVGQNGNDRCLTLRGSSIVMVHGIKDWRDLTMSWLRLR